MLSRPLRPKSRLGQNWNAGRARSPPGRAARGRSAPAAPVIIVWLVTGPLFHFSDTWQLVINTGTTIVTFLMVFLIQRAQNKDSLAIQLKLNEIVAAIPGASNRLIDVEDLSEAELKRLHQFYARLAEMAKQRPGPADARTRSKRPSCCTRTSTSITGTSTTAEGIAEALAFSLNDGRSLGGSASPCAPS